MLARHRERFYRSEVEFVTSSFLWPRFTCEDGDQPGQEENFAGQPPWETSPRHTVKWLLTSRHEVAAPPTRVFVLCRIANVHHMMQLFFLNTKWAHLFTEVGLININQSSHVLTSRVKRFSFPWYCHCSYQKLIWFVSPLPPGDSVNGWAFLQRYNSPILSNQWNH